MPTNPPLAARRKLLGATLETTRGTAATVSAALAGTIVYNAKIEPDGLFADGERLPNLASSGSLPRVESQRKGKCTFETEWLYDDKFLVLAQACGFKLATGSILTPSTDLSAQKTITFKLWESGRYKLLYGAAGKFTIEAAGSGQRVMVKWEYMGIFDEVDDAAMPAFTPVATKGWRAAGATLEFAGSAIPQIDGFTIESGSDVQPRETITNDAGLAHFIVGDIVPTMSIAPEARTVAQYDAWGKLMAGTAEALELVLTDAAGNTMTIEAPKAQRTELKDAERNKKLVDEASLELHISAGDDQIKFTQAAAA